MIPKIPDWKNLEMTGEQLDKISTDALDTCPDMHACFRCRCLIFGPISYWTYETEEKKKFLICEFCTAWLKGIVPEICNYAKHHEK